MNLILEQIAVGEYEEAVSPPADITALLCVAQERNLTAPRLPYHKVPIPGARHIPPEQLADAVEWIHRMVACGSRILVFSSRGQCRSPSVVIAYLCCKLGCSFEQALESVARKKPSLSLPPNLAQSIEEVIKTENR